MQKQHGITLIIIIMMLLLSSLVFAQQKAIKPIRFHFVTVKLPKGFEMPHAIAHSLHNVELYSQYEQGAAMLDLQVVRFNGLAPKQYDAEKLIQIQLNKMSHEKINRSVIFNQKIANHTYRVLRWSVSASPERVDGVIYVIVMSNKMVKLVLQERRETGLDMDLLAQGVLQSLRIDGL